MILFIFGDSITQGYWDDKGGWADRVKASVLAKDIANGFSTYHGVHNLGIDGNTTRQVIDRFEHETQARLWPGLPGLYQQGTSREQQREPDSRCDGASLVADLQRPDHPGWPGDQRRADLCAQHSGGQ